MQHYPKAFYYLVDANTVHQKDLENFTASLDNADYIIAAAGSEVGEVYFDNSDPHCGIASKTKLDNNYIVVPVTTIDVEVENRKLKGPFLIKLDTHGFEVPILEGASKSLEQANAVIIEVYNFQLSDTSLKFYEMCSYMEKIGFYPLDIADPMWRIYDDSFWQMDILFVKKDRPEFSYNAYR
jgi:FkbM family methyltransferase